MKSIVKTLLVTAVTAVMAIPMFLVELFYR
jgi:hypothetical protein